MFSSKKYLASIVSEPPSEDQLRKAMPQLIEFLSKMAGRRFSTTEIEELYTVLDTVIKEANKLPKTENPNLSLHERKQAASTLLGNLLQVFSPEVKIENPTDWLIQSLYKPLEDPPKDSYLNNTKFKQYRSALYKIVDNVYSQQKQNAIESIFADMPEDDFFAFFQGIPKLNKELAYLDRKHTRINKKRTEKYMAIDLKLSNFFEKLALQYLGISKLLDGVQAKYSQLNKINFADYVKSLSNKPNFSDLVQPMNVTIRNSLAHERVVIYPITREVKFIDKRKSVTMSYEEFAKSVHELSATTHIMSCFDNAMKLYVALQIRNLPDR